MESSIFAERDGHTLEFESIHLSTRSRSVKKKNIILQGVSGSFRPKSLTAIMGPSGAGKSSLIKALTGRIGSSRKLHLSGQIRLDGEVVDPTNISIRQQIAYVEQDVSVPLTCTPREAFTFSARLRLDKDTCDEDIRQIVEDLLVILDLQHVADSLIGGGKKLMPGGLSGGEKKRVQCGVELVTNPEIVIIDEPTTSLDSYSAQSFMEVLKRIANRGATVIVTIHQPSPMVVRNFDNLLLLLNGQLMYDGPMGDPLEEKFARHGFPKPEDYNIANWILQVAQTTSFENLEQKGFFSSKEVHQSKSTDDSQAILASAKSNSATSQATEHAGLVTQTRLLFNRELKKLYRDTFAFLIRIVSTLAFGLLFGFIFLGAGGSQYVAYAEVTASSGAMANIFVCTISGIASSSLMEFPKDRQMFLREYSTNHYSVLPYFLSKFASESFMVLIQVLVQVVTTFFLVGFRMNFFQFLTLNFTLAIASTSIGVFIGSCFDDPAVASGFMNALIVPQLLLSGVFIPSSLIPEFLRWAQYLCSLTYVMRLALLYEFGDCSTFSCISLIESNEVYELDSHWYWMILLVIVAVFRVASILILKRKAGF